MNGGEIGGLFALLGALAVLNQQVTEQVFGSLVSGKYMRLLSWGVGVALLYGCYAIAGQLPLLAPIKELDPAWLWAVGIFLAMSSNVLHGWITNMAGSQAGSRLIETEPGVLHVGPVTIGTPKPEPTTALTANDWAVEANKIYHDSKGGIIRPEGTVAERVAALNKKYDGIVPPLPPGWPV